MNRKKLKALVHYVVAKSDPSRLGSIRLNKIAWYADSLAYRLGGETITGETYIKRQHGPVPKNILSILGDLEMEKAIVIRERERFNFKMREFIAMSDPDLSSLSPEEIELIEDMRGLICDRYTASEISEMSHDQVWDAANIGEEIPMSATLASSPGEMTPEVMTWADAVIARYEQVAVAA